MGAWSSLRRGAAALVMALTAAAGCLWVIAPYTDLLTLVVSVDAERRWTESLWGDPRLATPMERRAEMQHLSLLSARLAARRPYVPYAIRVRVIEQPEAAAHALPGGLLVVTTGLLDVATSENALAWVLAHEIGHFGNRDHLRILGRRLFAALALDVVGVPGPRIGAFLLGAGLLTSREYTPAQEEAADRFALAALHAEYGHVGGPAALLEAMAARGWPSLHLVASPRRAGFRVASLRSIAREEGWSGDGDVRPWPPAP